MKKQLFLYFLLLCFCKIASAQPSRCYSYDAAGNRTLRVECSQASLAEDSNQSYAMTVFERGIPFENHLAQDQMEGVVLYPNPSTGIVIISAPNYPPSAVASLVNLDGKVVLRRALNDGLFDLSSLPQGHYMLYLYATGLVTKSLAVVLVRP